jgi:hypothetical protein
MSRRILISFFATLLFSVSSAQAIDLLFDNTTWCAVPFEGGSAKGPYPVKGPFDVDAWVFRFDDNSKRKGTVTSDGEWSRILWTTGHNSITVRILDGQTGPKGEPPYDYNIKIAQDHSTFIAYYHNATYKWAKWNNYDRTCIEN